MFFQRLWVLVCACVLGIVTSASAQNLDATQQANLDDAKKQLTQLQANLKLAQDSAGPGDAQPTGSRARLSQTRLAQAKQYVPVVQQRLTGLPVSNDSVKSVQTEFDTAQQAIAALEARLAGSNSPAAAPAPTAPGAQPAAPAPAAAPQEARLDYRQQEALKGAQFNLDQVLTYAKGLEDFVKIVQSTADKNTIPFAKMSQAQDWITDARRKTQFTNDQLAKLPAGHAQVKPVADQLASAVASIDTSEKTLAPVHAQLAKVVDSSSYPDLRADVERLGEFSVMYGSARFNDERGKVVELIQQLPATRAELQKVATKYAPLLNQDTPDRKTIEGAGNRLIERLKEFETELANQKTNLPAEIDADLLKVGELVNQAVGEQKPAFFTGGIPQFMGYAEDRLLLYTALDPTGAVAIKAKVDQTKSQLKQQQGTLIEAIIAANELPPDRYSGSDKEDLKNRAIAAWKKNDPAAQVLAVRFPAEQWKQEVAWRYSSSVWSKSDRSHLQAQVIVKQSDRVAAIQAINLYKDHMAGDTISAVPLNSKTDEIPAQWMMLVEKVK